MLKIFQAFILSASVALLFPGCATTMKSQLASLSDVFKLQRVTGGIGIWKWMRDDIYVYKKNEKPKYIGTVEASSPDFIQSFGAGGLEHRVLALSGDGRSIIFNHWAANAPSSASLEGGIYSYRYGEKLKKIITKKTPSTAMWAQWPKPLPKNILPFSYRPVTYSQNDMIWGIRAKDEKQFPLGLLNAKPIHQCAFDGNTPKCKDLLEHGAEISIETYWGFTPLDIAIIRNHEDTAIYLLERGANPDTGIYPAFHYAVMLGRLQVVQAMLARGIDVNKQDGSGSTPLHQAIYAGRRLTGGINTFFPGTESPRSIIDKNITTVLVRTLLGSGANPNITNKSGKTPLDVAYAYTPQEAMELLLKYIEK